MSIDSKLYVSKKWTKSQIVDIIHNTVREIAKNEKLELPPISMGSTGFGDHFFMNYNLKFGGMLMIMESDLCGIDSTLISAGSNKASKKLLKTIANKIGGVFIVDDSSDNAQLVEQPEDHKNADFILKEVQTGGWVHGDSVLKNESTLNLIAILKRNIL